MGRFLLILFLGWTGAHKFIEKKTGMGLLYLFTFGIFGIGWIIDTITALIQFLNISNNSPLIPNTENESLKAISTRFRGNQEDTVFVTTSNICPKCSIYNRRIFSVYGKHKNFPVLPHFLYQKKCPCCNIYIGFSHYFPGINGNLSKDITFSNRPFIDSRTPEQISAWNDRTANEQLNHKIAKDYDWITKNLPSIAPKNIGGYKRMISSNSANYQKIKDAAKDKGYII